MKYLLLVLLLSSHLLITCGQDEASDTSSPAEPPPSEDVQPTEQPKVNEPEATEGTSTNLEQSSPDNPEAVETPDEAPAETSEEKSGDVSGNEITGDTSDKTEGGEKEQSAETSSGSATPESSGEANEAAPADGDEKPADQDSVSPEGEISTGDEKKEETPSAEEPDKPTDEGSAAAPAEEPDKSTDEGSAAPPAEEPDKSTDEGSAAPPAEEPDKSTDEGSAAPPAEESDKSTDEGSAAPPAEESDKPTDEGSAAAPEGETSSSEGTSSGDVEQSPPAEPETVEASKPDEPTPSETSEEKSDVSGNEIAGDTSDKKEESTETSSESSPASSSEATEADGDEKGNVEASEGETPKGDETNKDPPPPPPEEPEEEKKEESKPAEETSSELVSQPETSDTPEEEKKTEPEPPVETSSESKSETPVTTSTPESTVEIATEPVTVGSSSADGEFRSGPSPDTDDDKPTDDKKEDDKPEVSEGTGTGDVEQSPPAEPEASKPDEPTPSETPEEKSDVSGNEGTADTSDKKEESTETSSEPSPASSSEAIEAAPDENKPTDEGSEGAPEGETSKPEETPSPEEPKPEPEEEKKEEPKPAEETSSELVSQPETSDTPEEEKKTETEPPVETSSESESETPVTTSTPEPTVVIATEPATTEAPGECVKSEFGCCPDRKTAARGPDNEGCPCETLPNGCCPDRMTAAQGPNNEGCPCPTLPYGCCPNSTKPASGPFFEGCNCLEAPHGCCADGVSVAFGPNYAGCKDGPPLDTRLAAKACALAKDRGTCRNYTVKWTYDMEYGGCIRFWYGGCEGNANRFQSQEECERICVSPEGAEVCYLPKVEGPCEGKYNAFYFNEETGRCESFIYGGCLGNKNRFDTIEACEGLCLSKPSKDACEMPARSGPCRGFHRRWYFDKNYGRCRQFTYGGCSGNANNFESEGDCQNTCGSASPKELCILPKAEGPCLGQYPRWYYDYLDGGCKEFTYTGCEGNRNRFVDRISCEKTCNQTKVVAHTDVCALSRDPGPCQGTMLRWYYDTQESRCKQFYYGGCAGNANKFETRMDCERACIPTVRQEENVCLLKKEIGNCVNPYYTFEERWYYDITDHQCHRFSFSGCGGNGNNFRSLDECQARCGRPYTPLPPPPSRSSTPQETAVIPFSIEHCALPKDHGPCYKHEVMWWYDSKDGVCKEFYYGGCKGNNNRFASRKDCETKCWNSQDICKLPKVRGPCTGNFVQWYYEFRYDSCMPFNYSLCNGNANRFSQKETCEAQCKRGPRGSPANLDVEEVVGVSATNILSRDPACAQPIDPGTGRSYIPQYFYDATENICRSFIWTGHGGNDNRFETRVECENRCVSVSPDEDVSAEEKETICHMNADSGTCGETNARWFYDPASFSCLPFVYTGCGGNKNRFKTFEVCQKFCSGVSNLKPEGTLTVHIPDEDRREEVARNPLDPYADRKPSGTEGPGYMSNIPFVPPTTTTTTTTPSTTTQRDLCRYECSDSPFFADCALIVQGMFCSNPNYARFCCKTCLASQQIDLEKVKEILIGENHATYQTLNEGSRICFYEENIA